VISGPLRDDRISSSFLQFNLWRSELRLIQLNRARLGSSGRCSIRPRLNRIAVKSLSKPPRAVETRRLNLAGQWHIQLFPHSLCSRVTALCLSKNSNIRLIKHRDVFARPRDDRQRDRDPVLPFQGILATLKHHCARKPIRTPQPFFSAPKATPRAAN